MLQDIIKKLRAYFRRLLFPLYLFPLKLLTYSLYYLLRALGRLTWSLLLILFDMLVYPFLSLRNALKSLCLLALLVYLALSLLVISDYFTREYGSYEKFFCTVGIDNMLKKKVVRIVGGYSEGSGFFITGNRVLTNFHVIDGETSPKIIFPDGSFTYPLSIVGDKKIDLALLTTSQSYPDLILPLPDTIPPMADSERVLSIGYPMGTDITGEATIHRGRFVAYRNSSQQPTTYIQTDINVVSGMSGGPLTDVCGSVVGVNAMGVAGLSMFIDGYKAHMSVPTFNDQDVHKIAVDATKSPEDAVTAYYTYIMARDLERGFALLSSEYLAYTSFEEWTARFTDILYIDVVKTQMLEDSDDTVFIKFVTKTWTGTEAIYKYYEGVWVTKLEDGIYKMRRSMIKEVIDPPYSWEWSGPEI